MFKDYLANLRRIGRDARLMIATQAIMGFGYVGLYAVLFNLYLLRLDYNPAYIGQVNAIGRLGFALVGVPAGLLGVRFGPRPLLIAGEWIIVIGLVGAPLGEFLPHAIQGPWISLFYFLGFAGASLFFVNATPFLMAVSGKQERSHVFAVLATVMPLAAFAGNLCGGLLAQMCGMPSLGFISAMNVNRGFADFLELGHFEGRPSIPTDSNAMDVGDPSNLERIRWLYRDDYERLRQDGGATDTPRTAGLARLRIPRTRWQPQVAAQNHRSQ